MRKFIFSDLHNISPLALIRWVDSEYDDAISKKVGDNKILKQKSVRSILKILSLHSGISQNDLAREVHLKGSTISLALDLMEKEELIRREQSSTDKRKINVFLCSKGFELKKELDKMIDDTENELLSSLSDTERYMLTEILNKILINK